jgi:uncharacterized CHY-type Zn-finger protein
MKKKTRKIILFSTLGERVVANIYRNSKLIVCGICGNITPEECYLNNDCPHCLSGIKDEV